MKKFLSMFTSRRSSGRVSKPRLALHRLEARDIPSVTAVLAGGILTITGDAGSDIVTVTTQGKDGDLKVQANNGQLSKLFGGNLVTELRANLGDGFNSLDINLTNSNGFSGDHLGFDQNPIIKVTSGIDADTISVNLGDNAGGGGGGVGDDDGRGNVSLTFDTSSGNDRLTVTAGGDFGGFFIMDVKVGGGNDSVYCKLDGDLDGNAKVTANLGSGNDTYSFEVCGDVKSDFEFGVIGDSGNDYITALVGGAISGDSVVTVDLGASNDNFSMGIGGDVSGNFDFSLVGGTGNDSASLDFGGNIDGNFTGLVDMGSSNDYFSLNVEGDTNGSFDLAVVTDTGDDSVFVEVGGDVNGPMSLDVNLGDGNDRLEVTINGFINSDAETFMEFDGGIGLDTCVYTFLPGEEDDISFSSSRFEDETFVDAGAKVNLPPVTVPAPTITSVTFGDGSGQRSLVKQIIVNFSAPVSFMGSVASAFTLHRTGTGGTTGDVLLSALPVTGPTTSVTLTFSGSLTENGSLVDGFYDFIAGAAQISGSGGALDGNNDGTAGGSYSITGSTANKFYRFFGDNNGDGTVNQTDFNAFRLAFLGGPNAEFDFDNDGQVSQPDFNAFRLRFLGSP